MSIQFGDLFYLPSAGTRFISATELYVSATKIHVQPDSVVLRTPQFVMVDNNKVDRLPRDVEIVRAEYTYHLAALCATMLKKLTDRLDDTTMFENTTALIRSLELRVEELERAAATTSSVGRFDSRWPV